MKPKLILISAERDLRNVIFLGDARFNSLEFKIVEKGKLTLVEEANKICEQTCGCKPNEYRTGQCRNGPCIFVVVRRTKQEREIRKRQLQRRYPRTDFRSV